MGKIKKHKNNISKKMNSLIINPEAILKREGEKLTVSSLKIYTHLQNVLIKNRLDSIENSARIFKITILEKGIYFAKILYATQSEIQFQIVNTDQAPLIATPWIDIIIGASRPQTMKKVLEHGTTFGVREFNIFNATLSEKSYLSSKIYTDDVGDILTDGLAQSARYFNLPSIKLSKFNPAYLYQNYEYKFVLDFHNAKKFSKLPLPDFSSLANTEDIPKIVLAIGPERGFIKDDLNYFTDNNFSPATISKSVLRVEHALFAALGQLELLTNRF